MVEMQVKPGDVIAGKYEVDQVLGAGGMGIVVSAHHLQLEERVAIKFLLPGALGNQEAVQRFSREARAAAKIKNDHVARVWDVGTLESGAPYIVMEYLEGHDLEHEIEQRGQLNVAETVDYLLQACEAIAQAHALGIVHRDLKPANLFLSRRAGRVWVKVLDFGISKTAFDKALTQSSAMMGSPQYMSPEQFTSSRDVDVRTDVWALGAIAYEALSGRPPFDGSTLGELCHSVMFNALTPLEQLRDDVPLEIARAVGRCLAKERADRFQHVGELANALAPFAEARGRVSAAQVQSILEDAGVSFSAPDSSAQTLLDSDAPGVSAATAPDMAKSSGGSTQGAWEKPESHSSRNGLLLAGAGVLAAASLAATLLMNRSTSPDAETTSAALAAPSIAPQAKAEPAADTESEPTPSATQAPATNSNAVGSSASSGPASSASVARPSTAAVKRPPTPAPKPTTQAKPKAASSQPAKPTASAGKQAEQARDVTDKPATTAKPEAVAKPASRADTLLDGRF